MRKSRKSEKVVVPTGPKLSSENGGFVSKNDDLVHIQQAEFPKQKSLNCSLETLDARDTENQNRPQGYQKYCFYDDTTNHQKIQIASKSKSVGTDALYEFEFNSNQPNDYEI